MEAEKEIAELKNLEAYKTYNRDGKGEKFEPIEFIDYNGKKLFIGEQHLAVKIRTL